MRLNDHSSETGAVMTECQKCRDRNRETSGGFLCIYCFDWTDDVKGVCPRCGMKRCVYVPPGEHARSVARIRDFIEEAKKRKMNNLAPLKPENDPADDSSERADRGNQDACLSMVADIAAGAFVLAALAAFMLLLYCLLP